MTARGHAGRCAALVIPMLLFAAVLLFFAYRDYRSAERCHALGGQTWDSGEHCAFGVNRVINTHNRTWG